MKKFSLKNLTYPTLIIAASSLLLFIILAILSFQNYHREKRLMEKYLLQEGLTLIRSLEAGARTGMMGMTWGQNQLQMLISETAKEPNIDFIMLIDQYGNIIAHNQSELIGEKITDLRLPDKSNPVMSTIQKNADRNKVFRVIKKIEFKKSSRIFLT